MWCIELTFFFVFNLMFYVISREVNVLNVLGLQYVKIQVTWE